MASKCPKQTKHKNRLYQNRGSHHQKYMMMASRTSLAFFLQHPRKVSGTSDRSGFGPSTEHLVGMLCSFRRRAFAWSFTCLET